MKKITIILYFVCMICISSRGETYKGSCGENVSYELNTNTKTLTIKGSGTMTDWGDGEHAPWYDPFYRDHVFRLVIQEGITHIGEKSFEQCSQISKVIIPNSVTSIGYMAFDDCVSIATLQLSENLTKIGKYAFRNCHRFKNLRIPDNVTIVDSYAFYACEALESVSFGNSVDIIGTCAFYGCRSLNTINFGISSHCIGQSAFANCPQIESITLPIGVNKLGNYAFKDCRKLSQVEIGSGLTKIGSGAFYGCKSLGSIVIPNNIISIGVDAFRECNSLTSVTIGSGVTNIGENAFKQCDALSEVHIFDIEAWCNINFVDTTSNPIYYAHNLYLNNEQVTKIRTTGIATAIKQYAFYTCTCLDSIYIDNAEYIGNKAFYKCDNLIYVSIHDNVQRISYRAFESCSRLSKVMIGNNVNKIESYAFKDCINIDSLVLGDNLVYIGDGAFNNCAQINSVTIPANVTKIGSYAFSNCHNLSTVICLGEVPATIGYSSWLGNNNYNSFSGVESDFKILVPCGTIDSYLSEWSYYASKIKYENAHFSLLLNVDSLQGEITQDKQIEYICDSVVTLSAFPKEGYHFVQWSDGVLDNPRIIKISKDTSLTAEFAINKYTLSVMCEAEEGHIEGINGVFDHGTSHNFTAIPNTNYRFKSWSDNVSDNPRAIILVQDTSITANFIRTYNVRFFDFNKELIEQQTIDAGEDAIAPEPPIVENYIFVGWNNDFTRVQSNLDIYSIYEPNTNGLDDIYINNRGTNKILHDGQIYIHREGKIYTLQGKQLE